MYNRGLIKQCDKYSTITLSRLPDSVILTKSEIKFDAVIGMEFQLRLQSVDCFDKKKVTPMSLPEATSSCLTFFVKWGKTACYKFLLARQMGCLLSRLFWWMRKSAYDTARPRRVCNAFRIILSF